MVVLFFSIPDGKRDVYIPPALPMFCLALAPLLPGLLKRRDVQAVVGLFTGLLSLGLAVAGAMAVVGDPAFELRLTHSRGLAPGAVNALAWTILAMGLWGGLSLLACGRRRQHALVSTLAMVWVLYSLVGYPLLNDSSSARGLMRTVGARLAPMPSWDWWPGRNSICCWPIALRRPSVSRPIGTSSSWRPRAGSGWRPIAVGCWSMNTRCCRASTATAPNWLAWPTAGAGGWCRQRR